MPVNIDEFINMALRLLGKAMIDEALLQAALARAQDNAGAAAAEIARLTAQVAELEGIPQEAVH